VSVSTVGRDRPRARAGGVARRRAGLTLIELVVVLVVLGLLASLVFPVVFGRVGDARMTTADTQVKALGTALETYRLDTGSYPTTDQGLTSLRERPTRGVAPSNWRGPYIREAIPQDPWGRPYVYRFPGARTPAAYDLFTLGRDGKDGGEGEDADRGVR
jgi:general secretion pathway protein G